MNESSNLQPNISPQVSVVILNWNGGEMVCNVVASVYELAPPIPSVIVVDNASIDGSDVEIKRRFPQVILIRNVANMGFAAGNNVGIRYALESGADCVLLLNNDALLDRLSVNALVSALFADSQRGAVAPKIYVHSPSSDWFIWAAGAEWRVFPPRVTMRGYGKHDGGQYDFPGVVEYATCCALLVRREAFEKAGLLDESYFMYHEDYAFCEQLRANGFLVWYNPASIVHHLVSASTGEGSPQKWFYWSESVVLFYAQRYAYQWWAIVPMFAFLMWVAIRELSKGNVNWILPVWHGVQVGLCKRIKKEK